MADTENENTKNEKKTFVSTFKIRRLINYN